MNSRHFILGFAALLPAVAAFASATQCPQHFIDGSAPELANPKMAVKTRELCNTSYAVLHSGIARAPLWSAELLTRENIESGRTLKREDNFHPDDRLPMDERAELSDFSRSNYDRGHMLPNKDFGDRQTQFESFSLSNIVAQDPDNNQNLWKNLEEKVRGMAVKRGALYVITGPLFEGKDIKRLNSRVLIPSHIWKIAYDPNKREGAAWLAPNTAGRDYQAMSIADLEKRIGINLLPAVSPADKARQMRSTEIPASNRSNSTYSRSSNYSDAKRVIKFLRHITQ